MSAESPNDDKREPVFRTRIFIEPDGRVVIENLSEEMLELARALNPDAAPACALEPADPPVGRPSPLASEPEEPPPA